MIVRRRKLGFRALVAPHGITTRQYTVLARLWEEDGLSLTEIAHRLYIDPTALSRTVHRMEQAGLVSRVKDDADRRSYRLFLTDRASELREIVQPPIQEAEARSLRGLSDAEVRELKRLLGRVLDNLTALDPDAALFADDE
jgi:DNA-binding MarR family transcriptional regulator